jgi:hypothetical protein
MALDPNDPMQQALFPVPADLVWPPPEYAGLFTFAPEPPPTPEQLALAEYGLPGGIVQPIPTPPPPPPPPPPVQRFGNFPPEETAGPVPAAADMPPDLAPMQPGLGIPADTIDAAMRVAPAGARDPWEVLDQQPGPAPTDDQQLTQAMNALDPRAPAMPPEYMTGRELHGYANKSPHDFAEFDARETNNERLALAQKEVDGANADLERQRVNHEIRTAALKRADAARAQVDHESATLAADGGFWDSRSDGQRFLGLLAIGVGAFVAGPGGRNQALEIWEKSIDRHVANAKRKLADKHSSVSRMYQRIGDDFLANETLRQATTLAAKASLQSQQQLFAAGGTSERAIAKKLLEVDADLAARSQAVAIHNQKQAIAEFEAHLKREAEDRQQRAQAEIARNNREQNKLTGWRIAVDAKQGDKRLALDAQKFDWDKQKDVLEQQGKADKAGVGGNVEQVVVDGKPQIRVMPLVQANGLDFNPEPQVKEKIIAKRTAVQTLHDKLGQLKEWREKHGGANKKTSPTAQAEYDRLEKSAVISYGAATGQSLADKESYERARDALLGADPSGYNISGVDERIDKALREVDTEFNVFLQGANYNGPPVKFVDFRREQKAPTVEDEALKDAMAPSAQYDTPVGDKVATLDTLVAMTRSSDPKARERGFAGLRQVAAEASTPFIREEAQRKLNLAIGTSVPDSGHVLPSQKGVKETAPGTTDFATERERERRAQEGK